jgi:hypothetical protein
MDHADLRDRKITSKEKTETGPGCNRWNPQRKVRKFKRTFKYKDLNGIKYLEAKE